VSWRIIEVIGWQAEIPGWNLAGPEGAAWQDQALCAQTDPEAFFPEKGGSTREAKRVCRGCEVRAQCLEFALDNDQEFGIWGGLSERERRKVSRQADSAVPVLCAGGTHVRTSRNRGPFGNCTDCQQERAAARARNGLAA